MKPREPLGGGAMFDRIADRYDLMNRIISLGLDRSWRRKLLTALELAGGGALLDLATGTGDVAIEAASQCPISVVGLDPSQGMLRLGIEKIRRAGLQSRIRMVTGDAQQLPFGEKSFDACSVSFGIRNFPDRLLALREMRRVLKPGGRACILELSEPRGNFTAPFSRFYIHHVIPVLGRWLSGEDEYRYLGRSIAAFPAPRVFASLMEEAGFLDVKVQAMPFEVAHLYVGRA